MRKGAFRRQGEDTRIGRCVVLKPDETPSREDIRAAFAEIDRLGGADFLPEGRPEQPPMPPGPVFPEDVPRRPRRPAKRGFFACGPFSPRLCAG